MKLFEMVTEKYPSLTCKSDVMPLIHAWSVWYCVDQGHAEVPERTMKGNAASTDNYTYQFMKCNLRPLSLSVVSTVNAVHLTMALIFFLFILTFHVYSNIFSTCYFTQAVKRNKAGCM